MEVESERVTPVNPQELTLSTRRFIANALTKDLRRSKWRPHRASINFKNPPPISGLGGGLAKNPLQASHEVSAEYLSTLADDKGYTGTESVYGILLERQDYHCFLLSLGSSTLSEWGDLLDSSIQPFHRTSPETYVNNLELDYLPNIYTAAERILGYCVILEVPRYSDAYQDLLDESAAAIENPEELFTLYRRFAKPTQN